MDFILNLIATIFGLIMGGLCVAAPMCLFRTLTKIDASEMGSGKNTKTVNRGMRTMLGLVAPNLVLGIARMTVQGGKDIYSIIVISVNILCVLVMYAKASSVRKADALNKREYHKQKMEDTREDLNYQSDIVNAKAQLQANKAMAKAGSQVVKAKTGTAVAQEKAKAAAVKASTAHMKLGAISNPSAAITYAQSSGALTEGKELADKMADNLMGNLAPTVIDGEYKDVTEEAKAMMNHADAELIERIKGMSRDMMCELLMKGAKALMLDTDDQTPEQIAENVIKYAPDEYVQSLPNELSNFEKAVVVVESSAGVTA